MATGQRSLLWVRPTAGGMGGEAARTLKCIEKWPTSCVIETPGRFLPLLLARYAAATTWPWTQSCEQRRGQQTQTQRDGTQGSSGLAAKLLFFQRWALYKDLPGIGGGGGERRALHSLC
jgi:hypothetical protein